MERTALSTYPVWGRKTLKFRGIVAVSVFRYYVETTGRNSHFRIYLFTILFVSSKLSESTQTRWLKLGLIVMAPYLHSISSLIRSERPSLSLCNLF